MEYRQTAAWVWKIASAAVVLISSPHASASPDTFQLGDGHTRAVTLSVSGPVNRYSALTNSTSQGDNNLSVADVTGFAAGDLVMLLQTTGLVPSPPSGDGTGGPVDLSTDPVGLYEFARVSNVDTANRTLEIAQILVNSFPAGVTQVILVPEYTDLTINSGVTVTAQPWNGLTGGVIIFFATGAVNNNGFIDASNQGFRGGVFHNGMARNGCAALDQSPYDGAEKGEGIQVDRYGPTGTNITGYGLVSNGAGGGVCRNSGGGGGGNGGTGGKGGFTWIGEPGGSRDVGGRGGTALRYSQFDHLSLGGGGGAGQGDHTAGSGGGAGGGAIYIRASSISGSGTILSNGALAANTSGSDAAGGGGAGGTITLRIKGSLSCGSVSARGGNGGSVIYSCPGCQTEYGPGGGGGGGRILLQGANIEASPAACPADVSSGVAGTTTLSTTVDPNYGATPNLSGGSYDGIATIPSGGGFVAPLPVPVITAPPDGSTVRNSQPSISGTEPQSGATVFVFIDNVFSCTSTASGGSWSCAGASLADGLHTAFAVAHYQGTESDSSNPVNFTVKTGAPAAPVITAPANNSFTNNNRPTISGTAESSTTVAVTDSSGRAVCSATTGAAGSWSCSPSSALADGIYTIRATATDQFNTTSPPSSPVVFTVKTTPPTAPVITTPTNNAIITTERPVIGGTAEPFSTVAVKTSAGALCTGTASSTGAWTCTPAALTDGSYTVTAKATDRANNTGPASAPVSFTINSAIPAAPVITQPVSGALVRGNRPVLGGSAPPNVTIKVNIDGVLACTTNADANGTWLCAPNNPLTDGSHSATATATSAVGKTSVASAPISFRVNTQPPGAPTILEPVDGSTTASSDTLRVSGTAEPGAFVAISMDGAIICTVTADVDGNWSCSPSVSLTGGAHTVSVRASNVNGAGPVTNSQFTVDLNYVAPFVFGGGGLGCSATGGNSSLSALLIILITFLLSWKKSHLVPIFDERQLSQAKSHQVARHLGRHR
jgi:hypothetical protein